MSENPKKNPPIWKQMIENAFRFAFNLAFVLVFQFLFGAENVLPGVAISVGLTMFPDSYIGVRPLTMAFIIAGLYTSCVAAGQAALISPVAALVVNCLFVLLIMILTCEPAMYKPAISFLLCFVFSQATPVAPERFLLRFSGALIGGGVVAFVTMAKWYQQGHWNEGRRLKEQVRLCISRRGYIVRMSVGIAIAMFIGMALHLKKPLWISIVVMSLTQLHYHETLERIRHRLWGNIVGILFFVVVFRMLVPEKWAFGMVLFLGYVSFFTSEYKYKQIVNAVSAVNASLVLLDTSTAIENRLACLAGGAVIVLLLYLIQKMARPLIYKVEEPWRERKQLASQPEHKLYGEEKN